MVNTPSIQAKTALVMRRGANITLLASVSFLVALFPMNATAEAGAKVYVASLTVQIPEGVTVRSFLQDNWRRGLEGTLQLSLSETRPITFKEPQTAANPLAIKVIINHWETHSSLKFGFSGADNADAVALLQDSSGNILESAPIHAEYKPSWWLAITPPAFYFTQNLDWAFSAKAAEAVENFHWGRYLPQ